MKWFEKRVCKACGKVNRFHTDRYCSRCLVELDTPEPYETPVVPPPLSSDITVELKKIEQSLPPKAKIVSHFPSSAPSIAAFTPGTIQPNHYYATDNHPITGTFARCLITYPTAFTRSQEGYLAQLGYEGELSYKEVLLWMEKQYDKRYPATKDLAYAEMHDTGKEYIAGIKVYMRPVGSYWACKGASHSKAVAIINLAKTLAQQGIFNDEKK